jgi:hypothetical protein
MSDRNPEARSGGSRTLWARTSMVLSGGASRDSRPGTGRSHKAVTGEAPMSGQYLTSAVSAGCGSIQGAGNDFSVVLGFGPGLVKGS